MMARRPSDGPLLTSLHGFLGVRRSGFLQTLKKRWCVLTDDNVLMWYRDAQRPPFDPARAADSIRIQDIAVLQEVSKKEKEGR